VLNLLSLQLQWILKCRTSVQDVTVPSNDTPGMDVPTKITIVLREGLETWQALNVTAFLASGVAAGWGELIGQPYEDGSGNKYLPMFGRPVLVFQGSGDEVARTHRRALDRGMVIAVYTRQMFSTGNDEDNRAVVRAVAGEDLDLVGLAVHGPRTGVDKVCKGLRLHP
jgi:hypothetical protein